MDNGDYYCNCIMDIITHTFTGIAVGTVVASFVKKGFGQGCAIVACSALGAAMPDLDALSLWSKFDPTLGSLLGLKHTGKEIYFSKFWYSHHGFLHSLCAAFLLSIWVGFLLFLFRDRKNGAFWSSMSGSFSKNKLLLIGFALGFSLHLLEDMPTPASTWGGVNLFWPSKAYIGGTGDIWWWNNYDLFLIVCLVILANLVVLAISRWTKLNAVKVTSIIFALGAMLMVFQIKTRPCDFAYEGHTIKYVYYELRSKQIQKDILGKRLFHYMERFDRMVKVNF